MKIEMCRTKQELGEAAGRRAAQAIRDAIRTKGEAHIVLATGASQFETMATLVASDVDWSKVTAFHLDEYIGLPAGHPASFRKYLYERFESKAKGLHRFHYVNGQASDPAAECRRVGALISAVTIDLACIGIGENGHLAFNDPPADFKTDEPFIIVNLDIPCRKQQLGEGWFKSFEEVPAKAISMSIRQIMKSRCIVCAVPDKRKAEAVKRAVEGAVDPRCPSSILQQHDNCTLHLDPDSASLLD